MDTRVLKKTIKYFGIFTVAVFGVIACFTGLLWLSYYLFNTPEPLFMAAVITMTITCVYQIARDRVEYERREEQYLVDKLTRDAERAEENRKFEEKYGVKMS